MYAWLGYCHYISNPTIEVERTREEVIWVSISVTWTSRSSDASNSLGLTISQGRGKPARGFDKHTVTNKEYYGIVFINSPVSERILVTQPSWTKMDPRTAKVPSHPRNGQVFHLSRVRLSIREMIISLHEASCLTDWSRPSSLNVVVRPPLSPILTPIGNLYFCLPINNIYIFYSPSLFLLLRMCHPACVVLLYLLWMCRSWWYLTYPCEVLSLCSWVDHM